MNLFVWTLCRILNIRGVRDSPKCLLKFFGRTTCQLVVALLAYRYLMQNYFATQIAKSKLWNIDYRFFSGWLSFLSVYSTNVDFRTHRAKAQLLRSCSFFKLFFVSFLVTILPSSLPKYIFFLPRNSTVITL